MRTYIFIRWVIASSLWRGGSGDGGRWVGADDEQGIRSSSQLDIIIINTFRILERAGLIPRVCKLLFLGHAVFFFVAYRVNEEKME